MIKRRKESIIELIINWKELYLNKVPQTPPGKGGV
jgi:hypothetical protein